MSRVSLEEIWEPNRQELTRDYVSLSELARRVQRLEPDSDDETVRLTVLAVIEKALRDRNCLTRLTVSGGVRAAHPSSPKSAAQPGSGITRRSA